MKTLDRYILRQFLGTFFFVLLLIVAVIVILDITEKHEAFIRHQLSYQQILGYYQAFTPFMANMVTPIAIFIATVFVTSRLAQRTEIIALLSGGISFGRLLIPYFIGAACITLCSFVLAGWILADLTKKRVAFETAYIDHPLRSSPKRLHLKLTPDTYLYVGHYERYSRVGTEVTLETIGHNRLVSKLSAKKMEWMAEVGKWRFSDWVCRKIDESEEHIDLGEWLEIALNLHLDDLVDIPKLHETLTLPELSAHIERLKDRGMDHVHIFLTEKYIRYMLPFAALILTFMGVVMAARKARRGMGLQVALGFALALIYIALILFAKGAAIVNGKHLLLTLSMPNLIFATISCFLYKLVPK